MSGQYAYVAYQGLLSGQPTKPDPSTGGFSVIDISTLGSPVIVANLDNGALPAPWTGQNLFNHSTSVAVSGHYAYVTAFNSGRLTAIDISNPTSPQIVGVDPGPDQPGLPGRPRGTGVLCLRGRPDRRVECPVDRSSTSPIPPVRESPPSCRTAALNGAYRIRVRGNFAYVAALGRQHDHGGRHLDADRSPGGRICLRCDAPASHHRRRHRFDRGLRDRAARRTRPASPTRPSRPIRTPA